VEEGENGKTCLNVGGIPVQPYWIMGGFIPDNITGFPENPDYTKSTAIVMQVSMFPHYESLFKGAFTLSSKVPSLFDKLLVDFEHTRRAKTPILPLCSTRNCQIRAEQTRRAD
jgi:hypothetical protein